jgi:hypothetical protein
VYIHSLSRAVDHHHHPHPVVCLLRNPTDRSCPHRCLLRHAPSASGAEGTTATPPHCSEPTRRYKTHRGPTRASFCVLRAMVLLKTSEQPARSASSVLTPHAVNSAVSADVCGRPGCRTCCRLRTRRDWPWPVDDLVRCGSQRRRNRRGGRRWRRKTAGFESATAPHQTAPGIGFSNARRVTTARCCPRAGRSEVAVTKAHAHIGCVARVMINAGVVCRHTVGDRRFVAPWRRRKQMSPNRIRLRAYVSQRARKSARAALQGCAARSGREF